MRLKISIKSPTGISDSPAFYIVQPGDSMDEIASRFGIDLQKLLLWNELQIDQVIFPGQELQIMPEK